MSTITAPAPAAVAFNDYARMQSDEALIFAAHTLKDHQNHAAGRKYWAIISILSERHPGAMDKALETARPHQSAIEILLPHIAA